MSYQLAIPWRVALQHCPPPLHQPVTILQRGLPNSGALTDGIYEQDCFEYQNRLETEKQSTQGWVNDHENPWVNDCENPHSQFGSPGGIRLRGFARDLGASVMKRRCGGCFANVKPILVWSGPALPFGV